MNTFDTAADLVTPPIEERLRAAYMLGFGRGWTARRNDDPVLLSRDEEQAVVMAINREIDAAIIAHVEARKVARAT
jgi:hypothetical protein